MGEAEPGGELGEEDTCYGVAKIEGHAAETEHCRADVGFGPLVEIIRSEELEHRHGHAERHDHPRTPVRPGHGRAGEADEDEGGDDGVIGDNAAACDETLGQRSNSEPEQGETGAEHAVDEGWQFDEAVVVAGEREEDAHETVDNQCGDHEKENAARGEDMDGTFDDVLPCAAGGVPRPMCVRGWFAEIQGNDQAENRSGQSRVDRPAHGGAGRGDPSGPTEK